MGKQRRRKLKLDEIGYWSEIKLDIIRDYAKAYSTILAAQKNPAFDHVYIDAFAGAGKHRSKKTGEEIEGSPVIVVNTQPPFKEYHFIDLDGTKVDSLRSIFGKRPDIHIHEGNCNQIMLEDVLPRVRFEDYKRGLCLLDPYGLHLTWNVIRTIDMNRNVFWHNPQGVAEADIERMNAFWGDESWRAVAYETMPTLFGPEEEKADNWAIAMAFHDRLKKAAGFSNVPEPLPMRNTKGAIVYYLCFASQKPVAQDIVTSIFNKYQDRGAI
jgi:three-Cys-motif partner protein